MTVDPKDESLETYGAGLAKPESDYAELRRTNYPE
jgi:hypothetical protein